MVVRLALTCSRNSLPASVNVRRRVLRWNSRTPRRASLGHAFADGGRRQAQVPGRFGKAAAFGTAHEAFDTAEAFHIASL